MDDDIVERLRLAQRKHLPVERHKPYQNGTIYRSELTLKGNLMNRKEAFNYLTDTVAVSYRPRRMPWEHDQDSPDVQRSVLIRWVDEIARHPQHVVEQAFSALMRHAPNQVPTLNEAAGQLRRLAESQRSQDRFAGDVLPPETGLCVAYEAYCLEVARLGRVPDETRFTKKFNAMFPS